MARNFIIFFEGKEGTSPLVRLLNTFDQVSVIHQKDSKWEPFDKHACGSIKIPVFKQCLESIYGNEALDIAELNRIYTRTAAQEIEPFSKAGSVGLKMRFRSKEDVPRSISSFPVGRKYIINQYKNRKRRQFKQLMFDLLKRYDILVFIATREDVLRWALSRYHGDGSGKQGHLQFKVAQGLLKKEDIPKINVNIDKFAQEISKCQLLLRRKRELVEELDQLGLSVYPLNYEDFCGNKHQYFENIFQQLEISISSQDIESKLSQGSQFQKVHSKDISEFVENHREVMEQFGQFQTLKNR